MKVERFCKCGMPWEPDMDQFGCWSCGASEPAPDASQQSNIADYTKACRTQIFKAIPKTECWIISDVDKEVCALACNEGESMDDLKQRVATIQRDLSGGYMACWSPRRNLSSPVTYIEATWEDDIGVRIPLKISRSWMYQV